MKQLAIVLTFIIIVMGCTHTPPIREPGTIGPCYGSMQLSPNISGCYYDTNYDQVPDIVLFYYWDGEKMELIMSRSISEIDEEL